MSLLKVKEEQLRERQEAKQLAEEHSRLEKELHLSKAVCERVRAEAAAEHAGLLEAQAKLEIAEESLVALQRENKVLVAAVENTQLPHSQPPTAPSTVERLGAPSEVAWGARARWRDPRRGWGACPEKRGFRWAVNA